MNRTNKEATCGASILEDGAVRTTVTMIEDKGGGRQLQTEWSQEAPLRKLEEEEEPALRRDGRNILSRGPGTCKALCV